MLMRHYCTVFDAQYLPQGLALYESLMRHSSIPFKLDVLSLDSECERIMRALALPNVYVHSEDRFVVAMHLEEVRINRTYREWCWSTASQLCEYVMKSGTSEVTYIDADCVAYSDTEVAFKEIGNRSIAIALHRLIPPKKHLEVNGIYNVGWVTFRNTPSGYACLSKWAKQVRERCSAEIGCGDQLYLDEFALDHGDNVCVFQNIGINAAPWNIGNWAVTEGPCVDGTPIVTFHAHEFKMREDGAFLLSNYDLRPEDKRFIYEPYVVAVRAAKERIASVS